MKIKTHVYVAGVIGILFLGSGCAQLKRIGDSFYTPQIVSSTNVVNTPMGPIDVVTTRTNWVVSSGSRAAAELPGEIGIPFGSLVTFLVMSALTIGAAIRSKKYREATLSALDAGNQFKEELKKNNIDVSGMLKGIVRDQKAKKTFPVIRKLLDLI